MFPFPGVVSQGVVSATALDPESSDTVLLCTDSGVVAEMHMESFTMGRSWDLGGLLGTRACEGMVWASDSQVRCASSVPDDARAPRAPLLIDAFCAHGVQGVLHVACMACRQTATTGPVSSQPFDLSTGSLWITDAKSVYDVRLTATSAVLVRSYVVRATADLKTDLAYGISTNSTKVRCRHPYGHSPHAGSPLYPTPTRSVGVVVGIHVVCNAPVVRRCVCVCSPKLTGSPRCCGCTL